MFSTSWESSTERKCVACGCLFFPLIDQMIIFTWSEGECKEWKMGVWSEWIKNKGITHRHTSLSREEYDVKNDDNKRKKEKGSFQSSLFNSRIYLLQEGRRMGENTFWWKHFSFFFPSLNFVFIIHRRKMEKKHWKKIFRL